MPMTAEQRADLETRLRDAESARHELAIGRRASVVSYGQGDGGHKSVTYTRTTLSQLDGYIADLKRQLGYRSTRRAIGVRF
jgi:hypothetical protein